MQLARDRFANLRDQLVALRRRRKVFGHRDVIARFHFSEQRSDRFRIIRRHLRSGEGHLACRLELLKQTLRIVFRLLHVRLIERIDAERRAGDGRGELPCEEDFAEVAFVFHDDVDDRMSGVRQLAQSRCLIISAQAHAYEETIIAIFVRCERRFAGDRNDTLPFFARRLRDELLDPQSERIERSRRDESQFVASRLGHGSDDCAELRGRILFHRRDLRDVRRVIGAIEKRDDVDAAQRGRHHSKV